MPTIRPLELLSKERPRARPRELILWFVEGEDEGTMTISFPPDGGRPVVTYRVLAPREAAAAEDETVVEVRRSPRLTPCEQAILALAGSQGRPVKGAVVKHLLADDYADSTVGHALARLVGQGLLANGPDGYRLP